MDHAYHALTPERQRIILEAVAQGNYLETACDLAEVSYDTLRHWRRRLENGDPEAQAYADFYGALKKASAAAERDSLLEIRTGDDNWQSRAWFLERRFRSRWGKEQPPAEDDDFIAPPLRDPDAPGA